MGHVTEVFVVNMYTDFRCLQYYKTWSDWSLSPEVLTPLLGMASSLYWNSCAWAQILPLKYEEDTITQ